MPGTKGSSITAIINTADNLRVQIEGLRREDAAYKYMPRNVIVDALTPTTTALKTLIDELTAPPTKPAEPTAKPSHAPAKK